MNRKRVLVWVMLVFLMAGCGKEKRPPGVCVFGKDHYCYAVQMPEGKRVTDYFSLIGEERKVTVSQMSDFSSGTVYYRKTMGGGWLGYLESETDKFIYLPEGFPEELVQSACASLLVVSGFLTMEQAAGYIPELR